jgi:hypothetical protein
MLQANQVNCDMLSCGAIPAGPDYNYLKSACPEAGFFGPAGGATCSSPTCAPYKPQMLTAGWGQGLECCVAEGGIWSNSAPYCTFPPASLPVGAPPEAIQVNLPAGTPNLTPANIVQPLPDITQANQPVPIPTEDTSCWCSLNQAINNNPVISLAILAAVAVLVFPKKGARGGF